MAAFGFSSFRPGSSMPFPNVTVGTTAGRVLDIVGSIGAAAASVFSQREQRKLVEAQAQLVRQASSVAPRAPMPIPRSTQIAASAGPVGQFQQQAGLMPFPPIQEASMAVLPGGAIARGAGQVALGALGGALFGGRGDLAAGISEPFMPTAAGARAKTFLAANPVTGKPTWFKPAGQPILWSGDLSACKRVNKVARRASRSRGRR